MLTSNHAPMLGAKRNGGTRRYQPQGIRTRTVVSRYTEQRRAIRADEKREHAFEAQLELDHGAETVLGLAHDLADPEAIARAEAIYDMVHDDTEVWMWRTPAAVTLLGPVSPTDQSDDEWLDERTCWLDEQDVEDILADRDDDRIPGTPSWGDTRVDYSEFVTGFIVR